MQCVLDMEVCFCLVASVCLREFWSLDEYVSASLDTVICGVHAAVCLFCALELHCFVTHVCVLH